jgi:hypothetical protein
MVMSHSNTARMLGYWQERRSGAGAPPRSAIDPGEFAPMAPQTFVLGRAAFGVLPFRLAGALVESLHPAPLAGSDFTRLWAPGDRLRVQAAIEAAITRRQPLLVRAEGCALNGAEARLEILLAPLAGSQGRIDRLLGFYQPLTPLVRLRDERIERLFLMEIEEAEGGAAITPPLRLAAIDGRLIA